MNRRLCRRQQVLGAVISFTDEERDLLLTALLIGNIVRDLGGADDLSRVIENWARR
jgi:hypothetical protein